MAHSRSPLGRRPLHTLVAVFIALLLVDQLAGWRTVALYVLAPLATDPAASHEREEERSEELLIATPRQRARHRQSCLSGTSARHQLPSLSCPAGLLLARATPHPSAAHPFAEANRLLRC
jgi:hypothetical protein